MFVKNITDSNNLEDIQTFMEERVHTCNTGHVTIKKRL